MKGVISSIAFLYGMLSFCSAQEPQSYSLSDTIPLEDVAITIMSLSENYLEATGSVTKSSVSEMPATVSISPAEFFNQVPGVNLSSGTYNTNRLVIRGVGSRTPYGTNRIRTYLDDIPLTSGDGISNLEDIDLLSVSSMEILKGPASALYGSGLGGVVRLNSPYPSQKGMDLSVLGQAGSFGESRAGASISFKGESMVLHAGYVRSASNGFRENSRYERDNLFIHARYFLEKHNISFTLAGIDLFSEIPSSLNEEDYLNNPEQAGGSWGDIHGYEEYSRLLTGISVESAFSPKIKNKLTLFSVVSDPYERRPFNILDESSSSLGFREQIEYDMNKSKFLLGSELFTERYNWKLYETLQDGQGSMISDNRENRLYLNSFALFQWRPADRVLLDAGLNMNILQYNLQTLYNRDLIDQSGSYRYEAVLSPRVGMSFRHREHISSFLSAGHGFSAPSLEETLLPEGIINTGLRPETGWNFEAGNRGFLFDRRLNYELTVYTILLKDLLVTERLEEDVFTGINAGKAWNSGLECMFRASLKPENENPAYNAGIVTSYNLSRNVFREFIDDGVDFSGNHLPGIPDQRWTTQVNGSIYSLKVGIQHSYTGKQWMTDENERTFNSYHLINLHVNWTWQPGQTPLTIILSGGIHNIFDTSYASMILINAPSFGGAAARYYYPGRPRYFYSGVKLTYSIVPSQGT